MRAMFTAAASLLICTGLFGCDRADKTQAPIVAVAPPCNCQPPAQAAVTTPVVARAAYHRRHHGWRTHERSWSSSPHEWHGESSESASSYSGMSSYSSSSSSADSSYSASDEYGEAEGGYQNSQSQSLGEAWVDGYGRSHYAVSGAAYAEENPAMLTAGETRKRMAPWHAYNSKCEPKGD